MIDRKCIRIASYLLSVRIAHRKSQHCISCDFVFDVGRHRLDGDYFIALTSCKFVLSLVTSIASQSDYACAVFPVSHPLSRSPSLLMAPRIWANNAQFSRHIMSVANFRSLMTLINNHNNWKFHAPNDEIPMSNWLARSQPTKFVRSAHDNKSPTHNLHSRLSHSPSQTIANRTEWATEWVDRSAIEVNDSRAMTYPVLNYSERERFPPSSTRTKAWACGAMDAVHDLHLYIGEPWTVFGFGLHSLFIRRLEVGARSKRRSSMGWKWQRN